MLLQPVVIPRADSTSPAELYLRSQTADITPEGTLTLPAGGSVSFDTYFGGFFASKWLRYTVIDSLSLRIRMKGCAILRLLAYSRENGETTRRFICEHRLESADTPEINDLPYGELLENCVYCFEVTAGDDPIELISAEYHCTANPLYDISIAIGICTFKREQCVENTLSMLRQEILCNKASPLYGKLRVHIADNGCTLDAERLSGDGVNIYPNKNAGGVGGFTRCMIEELSKQKQASHLLIMDDDARIEPSSLVRLYSFLSLLRPEHTDISVGGALLLEERPWLQYESGARWLGGLMAPQGCRVDMRDLDSIMADSARDELIDYTGWWFTCMPISQIKKVGLPLPIFLHRDDVEYGLRLGGRFAMLPGVAVWHEQFERKMTGISEYYDIRNTMIVSCIHTFGYRKRDFKRYLRKWLLRNLLSHRYRYAEMNLRGATDALRGIDWLKAQDGEQLNREIAAMGYPTADIASLPSYPELIGPDGQFERQYREIFTDQPADRADRIKKLLFSALTVCLLGGVWLPPFRGTVLSLQPAPIWRCFASRKAIHCDASARGFEVSRDFGRFCRCVKEYSDVCRQLCFDFDRISAQYRERWSELCMEDYWRLYLGNL